MKREKSAGAVVFKKKNNKLYYLLLHYPSSSRARKDYWDFPKGHLEKGEKEKETVKREIREETGLKEIEFIDGFREEISYFFKFKKETIFKKVVFYLVFAPEGRVKISSEHIGFQWLDYQKALEKLSFDNAKEILKKAHNYLKKQ